MNPEITCRIGPPLNTGERTFYLVGKVEQHRGAGFVYAKNSPLGLLVLEGEDVFFTSFDPDFSPADILPLLEEIRLQDITLWMGMETPSSG
jgi:hypothetical protein